ncbi:hypothetical protein SMC26_33775 [Actinomadura fulvescens]|uniref:Secreted protein n=1 Tax=Actinomadura fulvescens TaxID=46160 RepID=A0ABP6BX98_9ACTN
MNVIHRARIAAGAAGIAIATAGLAAPASASPSASASASAPTSASASVSAHDARGDVQAAPVVTSGPAPAQAKGSGCRWAKPQRAGVVVVAKICWNSWEGHSASVSVTTYDTKNDKRSACPGLRFRKHYKHHGWKWQEVAAKAWCANGKGKKKYFYWKQIPVGALVVRGCAKNFWAQSCTSWK